LKERWLSREVMESRDGFEPFEHLLVQTKRLCRSAQILPDYMTLEKLCLLCGLTLHNLWMIGAVATEPELAELDSVPDHVVKSVHKSTDVVSFDEDFIGPFVTAIREILGDGGAVISGETLAPEIKKTDRYAFNMDIEIFISNINVLGCAGQGRKSGQSRVPKVQSQDQKLAREFISVVESLPLFIDE
jgi:hypothetical protein